MAKTATGYCVLKLDTTAFHAAMKKAKKALVTFQKEAAKAGLKPAQAARLMRIVVAAQPTVEAK